MIRYTETTYFGDEKKYILDVIENKKELIATTLSSMIPIKI